MMAILFSSFAINDPHRGWRNDNIIGKDFNPHYVNFTLHKPFISQLTPFKSYIKIYTIIFANPLCFEKHRRTGNEAFRRRLICFIHQRMSDRSLHACSHLDRDRLV
ncbi:hypothetical protein FD428_05555 [Citrobacter sp. TBCP-5362]|nr:hypothetical protein EGX86_11590 [Citrobacter koseri]MBE0022991.1 hypothetical protein [Citrobacter koseri]MBE0082293.1 hypothetical protein [Citrobacter koseri]QCQ70494.1 hypothetical protein FD428_05555 [Citrobacter sp. TBCP-5362]QEU24739.1 hypothetical protein FOB54_14365 [Citrobacter koseri]